MGGYYFTSRKGKGENLKKTALALMLMLTLLVSSAELVEMAEANFMWIFGTVDPVPGTTPPSIAIYSPQKNASYSSSNVNLNFSVRTAELSGWASFIHTVEYSLDGGNLITVENSEVLELFDVALNLTLLSSGKHSLTVKAEVVVYRGEPMEKFFLDTNSTVYFTVDTSSSPSPSPSPEPTPTLEPIPTPTATPEPESFPTSLVMASSLTVAAVCAGLGLLVYLVKRK